MKSMDSTEQKPAQHPAEPYIFHDPQKRRLILCLLLALATLALYNPVTRAPFLNYDDPIYVTGNPQVRAGLTWNTIVWTFRTPKALDWHPMTWFSYALDRQIFGMNPEGYHTTNILLHAANAVLLFLILESATGFAWRSLAVAVLFALAPINVESVAWISERKNVLSMLFFLLALAASSSAQNGLLADYYDNINFTSFAFARTDPTIDFDWGYGSPDPRVGVPHVGIAEIVDRGPQRLLP